MDLLANLSTGFSVALTPESILFALVGCVIGTLVGVLPGIGPVPTVAILLPLTFHLSPISGLIMLSGIYYGAQYGGSITSILVNMPGETSSVVTCIDGHQMALQGRAGPALAVAALGSLFAGTVSTLIIACAAPPLATVALSFGAAEYFSLLVLGLVAAVTLASGSALKAIAMVVLGLLLGLVGIDGNTGSERFTFGLNMLTEGIGFVPLAIGLFGLGDVIANLLSPQRQSTVTQGIGRLWPSREDFRRSVPAVFRGTALGSIFGVLPGGGAVLSSFASYALEKRVSRNRSQFGRGAVEGVAGPEAANNAGAQTSFIPMLTLGIPGNPVMALMIGALTVHGILPGPQIMTERPTLFWGLIASMWIGNIMLVILNLPLIGIWVQLLRIPYRLLYLGILMFCSIGVYTVNNSINDIIVLAVFGILGYIFVILRCEPAPLLLGFVLGPMMEDNLRRALRVSSGDPMTFIQRPISLTLLVAAFALILLLLLPAIRAKREEAFKQ